jgi:uncharacterized protein (DUF697 family)
MRRRWRKPDLEIVRRIRRGELDGADEDTRRRAANDVVGECSATARIVVLQPIPLVDLFLISPLQVTMVGILARLYGYRSDRKTIMKVIHTFRVKLLAQKAVLVTAKFIPVLGTLVAASHAYAVTFALGQATDLYFCGERKATRKILRERFSAVYAEKLRQTKQELRKLRTKKRRAASTPLPAPDEVTTVSSMPTNLFLLQDLEERASKLPEGERAALRRTADWIKAFVAKPNKDLGRSGPICPFVVGGLERKTLWLAPERIASAADVGRLADGYKQLLLQARPTEGDDTKYKAIVVVETDASVKFGAIADDPQLGELERRLYADDGVVLGVFHDKNTGSAIYNASFQPFQAPVPFLLLRQAVISDWKFFLENPEWLGIWARRFGESAVTALAEQLRRTNWRQLDR